MLKGGYESYLAFVTARQPALIRAATLVSGDPELAQDLVQDALVKLALSWEKVRDGYPEAYVRRILYRDAISWRRRFRRERLGVVVDLPLPDPTDAADARLALRAALSRLTTKQRAVLVLRFYEDLSEHQTADLLGVGIGTVKSQTHAALSRLRLHAPELNALLTPGVTSD
ncbi:MAG TPA: SigE family RNA polymerase sigma factor [Kineosporiaceae bacterium]|nr:SigE family RNA polymerase sigma factor [Kineosporiaceae bacterium]